jgi:hypothetical protein
MSESGSPAPDWIGHWRVRRYDGAAPSVPTYYRATPQSWDVIKDEDGGLHVARHPILDIEGERIVLKDEGADDADAEVWRARVQVDQPVRDDQLRVVATTGPHEGAVGIAERIEEVPQLPASR